VDRHDRDAIAKLPALKRTPGLHTCPAAAWGEPNDPARVGRVQVGDRCHPRIATRPATLLEEPPDATGPGLIDVNHGSWLSSADVVGTNNISRPRASNHGTTPLKYQEPSNQACQTRGHLPSSAATDQDPSGVSRRPRPDPDPRACDRGCRTESGQRAWSSSCKAVKEFLDPLLPDHPCTDPLRRPRQGHMQIAQLLRLETLGSRSAERRRSITKLAYRMLFESPVPRSEAGAAELAT
jgi:hypothetical protein